MAAAAGTPAAIAAPTTTSAQEEPEAEPEPRKVLESLSRGLYKWLNFLFLFLFFIIRYLVV